MVDPVIKHRISTSMTIAAIKVELDIDRSGN